MKHTILIIEPDLEQGKRIARILIRSDYDAVLITCADRALRRFFQEEPDAVILSDRLAGDEIDWLSDRVIMMSDAPLIGLGDEVPRDLVARRLGRSTMREELPGTLKGLLESDLEFRNGIQ